MVDPLCHRIGHERRLALHYPQRQPIHKQQDVGNDVLGWSLDLELINAEELVVLWVVKINQFEGLTTTTTAQVLIHADVLGEAFPEQLVCLHQCGGLNQGDFSDHLAEIVFADPGVDALDCLLKVWCEHHILE